MVLAAVSLATDRPAAVSPLDAAVVVLAIAVAVGAGRVADRVRNR